MQTHNLNKRKLCQCGQTTKLKYGDICTKDIMGDMKQFQNHYYYKCKSCGKIEVVYTGEDLGWLD